MTKELTQKVLKSLKNSYVSDDKALAVRRALNKTDVLDLLHVQENDQKVGHNFSIDIKTMKVTSQGQSGRCWIFAGCNFLREETARKFNVEDFELSQNYVAYWDKMEKINWTMESIISLKDVSWDDRTLMWVLNNSIGDGGQWDMFAGLIEKYGIVPKSVFPETYAACHTRSWTSLVKRRLRKFAADVQKNKDDKKAIDRLKEKCLEELYSFSTSCFGLPPEKFDFEYVDKDGKYHIEKDLDPKSFYQKYIGLDLKEYASLIHSPTEDKPYYERFTVNYVGNIVGNPVVYTNVTLSDLKKGIINQLKSGQIVWFGSDVGRWGNREMGVWDMNNYDLKALFDLDIAMSKEDSLYYCESAMNHAMCITGVTLEKGKPVKWKIENSWGDNSGNKGYYLCSDEWFDFYVYQAVVSKKFLPKKVIDCLDKKPGDLNPWDPMGTLAD